MVNYFIDFKHVNPIAIIVGFEIGTKEGKLLYYSGVFINNCAGERNNYAAIGIVFL